MGAGCRAPRAMGGPAIFVALVRREVTIACVASRQFPSNGCWSRRVRCGRRALAGDSDPGGKNEDRTGAPGNLRGPSSCAARTARRARRPARGYLRRNPRRGSGSGVGQGAGRGYPPSQRQVIQRRRDSPLRVRAVLCGATAESSIESRTAIGGCLVGSEGGEGAHAAPGRGVRAAGGPGDEGRVRRFFLNDIRRGPGVDVPVGRWFRPGGPPRRERSG